MIVAAVMREFINEFKEWVSRVEGWVRADFNLTCYWWGNECVWHWLPRNSIASLNLEMEANAEVGVA